MQNDDITLHHFMQVNQIYPPLCLSVCLCLSLSLSVCLCVSLSLSVCVCLSLSLSLFLMSSFPGESGLGSFIGANHDGGGSDNWSYKMFKAPVKSSQPTNQHPDIFQAGCPPCHPTNSVKSTEGKERNKPVPYIYLTLRF